MMCGFVCLIINCFSSCFIMAQGESGRQRTFLELSLQTVSLVSNFLAPVTSICADIQLFRELKKTETDTDSSGEDGRGSGGNLIMMISSECLKQKAFCSICILRKSIDCEVACVKYTDTSSAAMQRRASESPKHNGGTNGHRCGNRPSSLSNVLKVKSRAWCVCVCTVPWSD